MRNFTRRGGWLRGNQSFARPQHSRPISAAQVYACLCVITCVITCVMNCLPFVLLTLQHAATLQHTATYCNILQHIATHLQHTATYCSILQHIATHCNTLQNIPCLPPAFASYFFCAGIRMFIIFLDMHCLALVFLTLQHAATLQYTVTYCNTSLARPQHSRPISSAQVYVCSSYHAICLVFLIL